MVEDRLTYRSELALLEPFTVEIALAGITHDARRMRVRNTIVRDRDDVECAVVESVALWFDLAERRPTRPPEAIADAWRSLSRTEDFTWLDDGR